MIARINPNVTSFYSAQQAVCLYMTWLCGCLFCCPLSADALQTTHLTLPAKARLERMIGRRRPNAGCCSKCLICCGISIFRCLYVLSPSLLRHLKARGNLTVMFNVDTEEELQEMRDKFGTNLDSIMTDKPSELIKFAKDHDTRNHFGI